MLRITVELVPGGSEHRKRTLAQAVAGNVSDLDAMSEYSVRANEVFNYLANAEEWEARGIVGPHNREQTVWALVEKIAAWAAEQARRRTS